MPALALSVDKSAISTELMTTNMVTVTLQSSGGFTGSVALTAKAVNGAGAAMPGWTVTLDRPSVELAANGSATAVATVVIPSANRGLAANLQIDATSSLGAATKISTVTVANQLTYELKLNGAGRCDYPAAAVVNVTNGTKIRWVNKTVTQRTIVHVESNADENNIVGGLSHQDAGGPGSAADEAYEQTVNGAVGQSTFWYCHSPGNTVTNLRFQVVP